MIHTTLNGYSSLLSPRPQPSTFSFFFFFFGASDIGSPEDRTADAEAGAGVAAEVLNVRQLLIRSSRRASQASSSSFLRFLSRISASFFAASAPSLAYCSFCALLVGTQTESV